MADPNLPALAHPALAPQPISVGPMQASSLAVVMAEEQRKSADAQAAPAIAGIAGHIREAWTNARMAKQQTVEQRMLNSLRARRGEYDPVRAQMIKAHGGSDVFAHITSTKCRSAASWIRDVLLGQGSEKAWGLKPTPDAQLSPDQGEAIVQEAQQKMQPIIEQGGSVSDEDATDIVSDLHDVAKADAQEEAREAALRMENKMEAQLIEGGYLTALDQFVHDVVTFPSAVLKGPIIRKRFDLSWTPDPKNPGKFAPTLQEKLVEEWDRVDPLMIFPSPDATTTQDGFLIERHRMSRSDLNALVGVPGYDSATIRVVIEQYRNGLTETMVNDSERNAAEGRPTFSPSGSHGLIDALQFWGPVSGRMLLDWGMKPAQIPDETKEYSVEAWLIGQYVIKATLNPDPLDRRPYYKCSYEEIPGAFWGNSVADLVRDCQDVCNAAARAVVNNMAIASGPQVAINVDAVPAGEDLAQLVPWRIWQMKSDPSVGGNTMLPIQFFQPHSNTPDLLQVFEKFSTMSDEYSGIPRYMAGESPGTVGRTASGMSMLLSNAGKSIKQVIANIDMNVMRPLLQRLYDHNMQYSDDPDLKGDIHIVARGAAAVIERENATMRRNEFLASTNNPTDMQIIGINGRATVLREVAKGLDLNVDEIVPSETQLKINVAKQQASAQQAAMQQQAAGAPPMPGAPPQGPDLGAPGGPAPVPPPALSAPGQTLPTGAPITDHFSPRV